MANPAQTYDGSNTSFYLTAPRHAPPAEEGSRIDPAYFEAGCITRWAFSADQVVAERNTRCGPVTKRRAYWNNLLSDSETSPNLIQPADQDFESWNLSVGTDYQQEVIVDEWNTRKATGIRAVGPPGETTRQRSPDFAQPLGSTLDMSVFVKNETAFYSDFSDWQGVATATLVLTQDEETTAWGFKVNDATRIGTLGGLDQVKAEGPLVQVGTGNEATARMYVSNVGLQHVFIQMVGAGAPIDFEQVLAGQSEVVVLNGIADQDQLRLRIVTPGAGQNIEIIAWHDDIQTNMTVEFPGTDAPPVLVAPFNETHVQRTGTATDTQQNIEFHTASNDGQLDIIAFQPEAYNLTSIPTGPTTDTGPIRWTLTVQVAAERMEENHPTVTTMFNSFFGILSGYMAPNPLQKFLGGFDNRDALVYWIASPREEAPGISQLNSAGRITAFEQNQDPDGLVTYTFTMRGEYRLDFGTFLDP